jgi:hypothetical protein
MDQLRIALEEQIAQNFDFSSHAVKLEEIRVRFAHSIKLLPFPEPLQDCNCVMYALDFRMEKPSTLLGRFYANTDYLHSLINQSHLVDAGTNPGNGSLAVYFNGLKVEHVGVVGSEGRIASKWGIGYVYEHQPLEVPSTYGTDVRYFRSLDPDVAYELLKKHHHVA